jgi:hypothetical protein
MLPASRGGTDVARNRRRSSSVIASFTAIAVLVVALAGSAAERSPAGAGSPEALLARARTAAADDAVAMIVCCLTPDDRIDVALGLVVAAAVGADFARGQLPSMLQEMEDGIAPAPRTTQQQAALDAARAEVTSRVTALVAGFDRLLQRHGLPAWLKPGQEPPPEVTEPGTAVRATVGALDQASLLHDTLAYLDELGLGHRREELRRRLTEPWRGEAKVTDLRIKDNEAWCSLGTATVEMVRQDGRWYLRRLLER